MRRPRLLLCVSMSCLLIGGEARGQSALLGDEYTVSLSNLPGDVGVIVDPETQTETDHGTPPLSVTFDGVEETFGEVKINERVVAWPGRPGGIPAVQATGIDGETMFDLLDWENSGEIIEFSFTASDGEYLSDIEDAQSFVSIRDLDWRGAPAGEAPQFYLNSWYLYYTIGGQAFEGYEMQLPDLGLLVGEHPFDDSVNEVAFIAYGGGQVEDIVDITDDGLNLYFGTSQLDAVDGSWELLANVLGFSGIGFFNEIGDTDGLHIGLLVTPPVAAMVEGDFNNDGLLTAEDVDLLSAAVGGSDPAFDLNQDQAVDQEDRRIWVEDLAGTYFGDADFSRGVEFADFLLLSANFGQAGGWALGNFDGLEGVGFPDFLLLSENFGKTSVQPEPVPEPSTLGVLCLGMCTLVCCRRRKRSPYVRRTRRR